MEIMDRKAKQKFAVVCMLPVIVTIITTIFYLVRIAPIMGAQELDNHRAIMSAFDNQYGTILIGMLLVNFFTHLASLLYCTVHIAKIVHMTAFKKIMWLAFLAALMPVSLVVFYFLEIRNEPKYLETYPNIA
ncbi:MAG: hypothetical protein EOP56_15990 [Sphingobacteriales bacterium]|nr:MAG: hypothetical protein EOP56_15990 [Sphingobacteriales bacterium]